MCVVFSAYVLKFVSQECWNDHILDYGKKFPCNLAFFRRLG